MAICLLMTKEFEDEEIVIYQYYPSESPEKVGKMYFHKKEEMFYDLEPVPEESTGTRKHYFNCAISRIVICLRNGGEFLEEMTYGV